MENGKPSIDERLEAVATSLELLSVNMHAAQEKAAGYEALQARLDARERKGREALLSGISAYLCALQEPEEGEGK
jgi:hypothetical protein